MPEQEVQVNVTLLYIKPIYNSTVNHPSSLCSGPVENLVTQRHLGKLS